MISRLQYITQQTETLTHLECVSQACEAGCDWIQLRMKNEPVETILKTAFQARKICDTHKTKLIINDHVQIAKQVSADGVHLGKADESVEKARRELGGKMIIGATANTFDDILAHTNSGADYIGLGPFRFTTTKKRLSPILGRSGYREILKKCRKSGLETPVLAIGGIRLEDISELLKTGIYGIAVSSLITNNSDKQGLVDRINVAFGEELKTLNV
jgi:thiamine-phosphate pyrophosphorylase